MTDTIELPLNKLVPWDGNVRKTGANDGLDELCASILAHGLLQPLVVRKASHGKYAIVAGQRRYLALKSLTKQKRLSAKHTVACRIIAEDANATEISLAENVVRAPMHPADQFEAFRKLIDDGATIADVAARFGIADSIVTKRLKLGKLSSVILAAYRSDEIDLETVQAFTVSDDHAAQESVFSELSGHRCSPQAIRRALTEGEIPATDKRVRFVGLEAYEAAGGGIKRDLFAEDNDGYVLDAALLDRLVQDRLGQVADGIRAEGWKWVKSHIEIDHDLLGTFHRRYPDSVDLSPKEEAERESLTADYDELSEQDSEDADTAERLQAITDRLDELDAKASVFSPEVIRIAGAIVGLFHDGSMRIERGLIAKENLPPESSSNGKPVSAKGVAFSAALIEDLFARKSAAISATLMSRPDVALATVVHALALHLFHRGDSDSAVQISAKETALHPSITTPDSCEALALLEAQQERWRKTLPDNPSDLWSWCFRQDTATLHSLMAFCAALSVDAVHCNADALAEAVSLDMTAWFTPTTAADYFSRVSRAQIIADLCEAKGCTPAPAWDKFKKADLATLAERQVAGTGWLPKPLRPTPVIAGADDDVPLAAE